MKDHHELAMEEHARRATWMQETGGYAKDMTLRDHFAATVIQGHFARHGWGSDQEHFEDVAQGAYRMADAMLKAREAK